ncbi:hypothetical protein ACN28S_21630 [Cystobacter fuscus]
MGSSRASLSVCPCSWLPRWEAARPRSSPVVPDAGPTDGNGPGADDAGTPRITCTPARSNERIPLRHAATREVVTETFDNLRARVDAQCGSCHKAPEIRGGFQYTSDLASLRTTAPAMARMATQGAMPPLPSSEQLKQAVALGQALSSWLAQGTPEGSFEVREEGSSDGGVDVARGVGEAMTDLGHCIPESAPLGGDPEKDAWFARATALPRFLSETDTDIVTFDAEKLARRGTVAFAPTYPLFSDHAKKLRQVHVPAGTSIRYDAKTKHFEIPPNTRFYKTFFKPVKDARGQVGYRKIETRLIVVRQPWKDSLFGTYIWNEDETVAELHDLRYRDGSSFSDRVIVYRTDEATGTTRNYAIPGRHRCVDCHTGSEGQNFVLGFTPLQLNRRPGGEGGVDAEADVLEDELSQVDRLISYGVLTGIRSSADLPRLETYGSKRAQHAGAGTPGLFHRQLRPVPQPERLRGAQQSGDRLARLLRGRQPVPVPHHAEGEQRAALLRQPRGDGLRRGPARPDPPARSSSASPATPTSASSTCPPTCPARTAARRCWWRGGSPRWTGLATAG